MLAQFLRVKLLVPTMGGLSARPFVPDTTDRSRFPPRIRLEATLLGARVGALDMSTENGDGHIRQLSVSGVWPRGAVATRLLQETERVARLASWTRLTWELPADDPTTRTLARACGFDEVAAEGDVLFQKLLASGPRPSLP
jgi:hypothetical protein